jgi:hypothetical protein
MKLLQFRRNATRFPKSAKRGPVGSCREVKHARELAHIATGGVPPASQGGREARKRSPRSGGAEVGAIGPRGEACEELPWLRYGTRLSGWRSGVRRYPSPVAVCRRGMPRAAPDERSGEEKARVAACGVAAGRSLRRRQDPAPQDSPPRNVKYFSARSNSCTTEPLGPGGLAKAARRCRAPTNAPA